ncbi:hypothetical protein HELRODRAFT_65239, partial [Helobdella robusta]|uniref:non-specific serine/threonine protein kinase n=1 Tax=Helobdella robusta TaxID=6412 RepID=T1FY49_HELRO
MSSATSAVEERCHPIGSEIKVGFYYIIKTIGKGNTAIVKLARHSITKSEVAIKIIDKSMFDSPSSLDKIHREINILKFFKHPNIIKLYQVMESDKFIYIVSEFAPKGEIFEYISRNGRFSEAEAKIKFAQILNAVDYCHKLGIVHRDLKAENLLLDENFNVKLADFGFGNFYHKDSKLSTWCGSPPYAAPEIFEGRTYYGPEVDVWSLGVILYVLVCGMLPFDGSNLRVIRDRVVSGRFRIPYFMSMECERLVRRMLVVDPKKRYTIQQIQQHSWIHATLSSTSSQLLEESFREQLVVTGRGISMNCHEIVLQKMEGANISKEQVIKSLESRAYDNFTAIYELLLDKI